MLVLLQCSAKPQHKLQCTSNLHQYSKLHRCISNLRQLHTIHTQEEGVEVVIALPLVELLRVARRTLATRLGMYQV